MPLRALLVVALGLSLPACGSNLDEPAPLPASSPLPNASSLPDFAPLSDLPYAGCDAIWLEAEPRCIFEPGTSLRVWLDHPVDTQVTLHIDGQAWPTERYTVDGFDGFGLSITPPPGAEALTVELAEPHSRWTLALRTQSDAGAPPPPIRTSADVDDLLGDAFQAGEANQIQKALQLLARAEPDATRYPKGRAELATYRGTLLWRRGRHHEAATLLRQGVTFGKKLRDATLLLDSVHLYAGVLVELGYHDAAADWIEEALTAAPHDPARYPCPERARLESTAGYIHLLLGRHRGEASPRARPLLEQALARVSPEGECPEPSVVPGILLSLADVALDHGDPERALATLAEVRFDDVPTADERLRLRDAELRALDEAGRPEASLRQSLARLEEAAADAGTAEARWRLALRRGDVLSRQGLLAESVAAYRAAEDETQRIAELAVGVGRDAAVTAHGESTDRLMAGLVAAGRTNEALCVAREAEARRIQAVGRPTAPEQREALDRAIDDYEAARRALDDAMTHSRSLSRRDRERLRLAVDRSEDRRNDAVNEILRELSTWQPHCEDLSPRTPGELLLGLYPARRGWWVFVQDDSGTDALGLAGGPVRVLRDPALASELLEPFRARIAAARRVRVLASGMAQQVDVHLLAWNGRTLVEHVPVAYGAELPRLLPMPEREPVALVVADPTETLDLSPKEVDAATRSLVAHGWTLEVPAPAEANRERILAGLERASFFYFSGHGEHDERPTRRRALPPYAGGTADWPARLRLALPTVLEVQDVLMLPSAPRHVALLGCETGVPSESGGGMSLALAFLVAGAEAVVATPEPTKSELAFVTGLGLLESMPASSPDLVDGLSSIQATILARGESAGRYRVWVR